MNSTYVLECPSCGARFPLKRHVPDKRVRCRKCRAVMAVPAAPGQSPPPEPPPAELPPETHQKLRKALSLKKWLAASLVLLLAVAGAAYLLAWRLKSRADRIAAPTPEPPMTFGKLQEENRRLAFPLALGYAWRYSNGEERRVIESNPGPTDEPHFTLAVSQPGGAYRQRIRYTNDGGLLLEEETLGVEKRVFSPPVLLLPRLTHSSSAWSYSGAVERGGTTEAWGLEMRVTGLETLTTPLGTFQCFRIQFGGLRGSVSVEETHWYAIGIGLVQRRVRLPNGEIEEAKLQSFARPGG